MQDEHLYLLAADLILVIHTLVAGFILLGLIFTLIGKLYRWSWVRNPWFRLLHLAAMVVVVLQSWFGRICPLTEWEMALREKAGGVTYEGTFISHWLAQLLYHEAPLWAFALAYTLFGGLVIASWFWVKPRRFSTMRNQLRRRRNTDTN